MVGVRGRCLVAYCGPVVLFCVCCVVLRTTVVLCRVEHYSSAVKAYVTMTHGGNLKLIFKKSLIIFLIFHLSAKLYMC
jgi:phosphatidylglycerophosphate synthase